MVLFFIVPICVSLSCSGVLWYGSKKKGSKSDELSGDQQIIPDQGNKQGSIYSIASSETSSLQFSIVSSASRMERERLSSSRLRRLALYTIMDTIIYFICWGPLHLSGAFSKLIQEEMMMGDEMEDTVMTRLVNVIMGPHREDHLRCLHRLVIVSRLFHYIYFCSWPFLHLRWRILNFRLLHKTTTFSRIQK